MSVDTVRCEFLLGELLEMEPAFDDVFSQVIKDGPTTFAFAVMLADANKKIKIFNDTRAKLAKALGTDKGDGTVVLPQDKVPEYNTEVTDMLQSVVELDVPVIELSVFQELNPPVAPAKLAKILPLFRDLTTE